MIATTYPVRHKVIRQVLVERGWTLLDGDNSVVEAWAPGKLSDGTCSVVRLPVKPLGGYDRECERAEIQLGLRLPPEVQRAVDAERARCAAILRTVLAEHEEQACAHHERSAVACVSDAVVAELRELLAKIESGEVAP